MKIEKLQKGTKDFSLPLRLESLTIKGNGFSMLNEKVPNQSFFIDLEVGAKGKSKLKVYERTKTIILIFILLELQKSFRTIIRLISKYT